MPEIAYLNGVFSPIADATVSIEDRGFQFGDGIYEVVFAYGGRPFLLDPHMQRFRRSAAAIDLPYDFDADPLEPIIEEGLRRCGFADAMVYMQLTRGVAPRVHLIPPGMTPTVVMTFKPVPELSDDLREKGVSLMSTPDTRWASCSVKAIILLPNILAKAKAVRCGFDDALFVAADGAVRECTSANVFIAAGGRLMIPPRTDSVLHGITQGFVMECAAAIDVPVVEEHFDVSTLRSADEVFISSTAVEVLGVTSVDKQPIGDGSVGPITSRLAAEFHRRCRQQVSEQSRDSERACSAPQGGC